jgi:hypothetical protein
VKPLHKKGDQYNMTNCRPLSLLPIFSKVLEKVMHSRLSHHAAAERIQKSRYLAFIPDRVSHVRELDNLAAGD